MISRSVGLYLCNAATETRTTSMQPGPGLSCCCYQVYISSQAHMMRCVVLMSTKNSQVCCTPAFPNVTSTHKTFVCPPHLFLLKRLHKNVSLKVSLKQISVKAGEKIRSGVKAINKMRSAVGPSAQTFFYLLMHCSCITSKIIIGMLTSSVNLPIEIRTHQSQLSVYFNGIGC